MEKNNIRRKIFLVALVFFGALFFLFSCKKELLPDKLVVNGGNHIVLAEADWNNLDDLEVIALYNSGQFGVVNWATELTPPSAPVVEEINGISFYKYESSYIAKPELKLYVYVYVNENYVEGQIDFNAVPIALETKVAGGFNYNMGYEFDEQNVVSKIIYSDGSTNYDRGESVPEYTIGYKVGNEIFEDLEGDVLRKIILRGGVYEVIYTIEDLNLTSTVPVIVAGGESPINIKYGTGAQWFDYTLVIWIASILRYTSFGVFAVGILFTTIIVRTLAWPIYANSNSMSFKMAVAAPDLQKLEEKYRGRTDAMAKQQKQMEQMKIYKKHGVKFTGCFLMLLQFPIFTAMWQVVRRIMIPGGMYADQIADHRAFGIDNFLASGSGSYAFSHIFLVVIMAITYIVLMLLGQKKPNYIKKTSQHHKSASSTPSAGANPMGAGMGKMMIWVMTIMMIFMAFTNNNALTFYWIVGNMYSIFQTSLMRHLNAKKYRLMQVKSSLGSLYDDKNQRLVSYKQMVIDELENEYYDVKDRIANPYTNSKFKTFLNKVYGVLFLRPGNFFRKINLNLKQKDLVKFKEKHSVVGGK